MADALWGHKRVPQCYSPLSVAKKPQWISLRTEESEADSGQESSRERRKCRKDPGRRRREENQVIKSPLSSCRFNKVTSGETLAKTAPSGDMRVRYADGLTQDTFKICKEFLRPFKKSLRKLNLPKDFPKEKRVNCTRKNLTILGDHINMFLQHYCKTWELKHWKKMLWRFVSLFSALDEKQLCKLYRYSKTDQFAKFLKAYCRLESPDLVTLPEKGKLVKLRETWRLAGGAKVREKLGQIHSLSRDHDPPSGSSRPKERHPKTRKKRGIEGSWLPHTSCAPVSFDGDEETGSSSSSNP